MGTEGCSPLLSSSASTSMSSGRMESLELNYEEVKEILMCSICQDGFAWPPIHQCPNGHIICSGCIDKISECPVCRVPLQDLRIRNIAVEQLTQNILVDCKHKKHGCTARVKMMNYAQHLSVCAYQEFNYCQLLGANCDDIMSQGDFPEHVTKSHSHTCFHNLGNRGLIYQEINTIDLQDSPEVIWEPVFLQDVDKLFAIMSKFEKADQVFTWRCTVCPFATVPNEEEKTYQIHMMIESEKCGTKLQWSGPVISINKLKEEGQCGDNNDDSLQSFCIPKKTLRGFVSDDTDPNILKWTTKVVILEGNQIGTVDPFAIFQNDMANGCEVPIVNSVYYHTGPEDCKKSLHSGITCDRCFVIIRGVRYKCTECPDFDLCEDCEKRGVHDQHVFLRSANATMNSKMKGFFQKLFQIN